MFFIPKHIDINVVHYFYFSVIFLCCWKGNICIIQIFYVFFITFLYPFRISFLWIQVSNVTPSVAFVIFILKVNQSFCRVSKL